MLVFQGVPLFFIQLILSDPNSVCKNTCQASVGMHGLESTIFSRRMIQNQVFLIGFWDVHIVDTLPKTNIAPKNDGFQ